MLHLSLPAIFLLCEKCSENPYLGLHGCCNADKGFIGESGIHSTTREPSWKKKKLNPCMDDCEQSIPHCFTQSLNLRETTKLKFICKIFHLPRNNKPWFYFSSFQFLSFLIIQFLIISALLLLVCSRQKSGDLKGCKTETGGNMGLFTQCTLHQCRSPLRNIENSWFLYAPFALHWEVR